MPKSKREGGMKRKMLSRKYYRAIADAIYWHTRIDKEDSIKKSSFIDRLSEIFGNDNPNFSSVKFREACNKQR